MIWHSNSVTDVLRELQVDAAIGLSTQEAAERLDEYGENRPQTLSRPKLLDTFITSMRRPFTLLLLAVSIIVLILSNVLFKSFL